MRCIAVFIENMFRSESQEYCHMQYFLWNVGNTYYAYYNEYIYKMISIVNDIISTFKK